VPHRSPLVVALLLSTLALSFASAGIGEVGTDATRDPLQLAQSRLSDAAWTLALSVLKVDGELKQVARGNTGAEAVLEAYRLRLGRHLAQVRALQRASRPVVVSRDPEAVERFLAQVGSAHLITLRLSSSLPLHGLRRVRDPDDEALDVDRSANATSACYGSVAGTVRGPGGPLAGALVAAYTAEGIMAGSALTQGDGSYQIDSLLTGEDFYLVTSNESALIDEVFDNAPCPGGACDPTIGTPVRVSPGVITAGYDFALAAGGRIGGALSAQPGPLPLPLTTVNIFDATGELVTSAVSDFNGLFLTESGLPTGTYYLATASLFGSLDELYDDLPCPAGAGCDPTVGTAVAVTAPNTTPGIDFELAAGGNIAGNITDSDTNLPLGDVLVGIHDTTGLLIAFGASSATGDYSILSGLPTGSFFAATGNLDGYVDELYDDIACTAGLCTITGGTPIAVTLGSTTSGIDFSLSRGGSFSGRVTKAADGTSLADVFVLGHTASGDLVGSATTDSNGNYTLTSGLETGNYRATTLNPLGLDDLLFDAMACPDGVCDVTTGTPIAVIAGSDTSNIDFALTGDALGACGFEGCSTCSLTTVP
jgi:hypothetical protein